MEWPPPAEIHSMGNTVVSITFNTVVSITFSSERLVGSRESPVTGAVWTAIERGEYVSFQGNTLELMVTNTL